MLGGRLGADTPRREIRHARIRHAHYARVGIIPSVGETRFPKKEIGDPRTELHFYSYRSRRYARYLWLCYSFYPLNNYLF